MKAILQYQEVKAGNTGLICTARYLTDMPMDACDFEDIRSAFSGEKIETIYIDGATGCWGAEIKATSRKTPLPLLLEWE